MIYSRRWSDCDLGECLAKLDGLFFQIFKETRTEGVKSWAKLEMDGSKRGIVKLQGQNRQRCQNLGFESNE